MQLDGHGNNKNQLGRILCLLNELFWLFEGSQSKRKNVGYTLMVKGEEEDMMKLKHVLTCPKSLECVSRGRVGVSRTTRGRTLPFFIVLPPSVVSELKISAMQLLGAFGTLEWHKVDRN